MHLPLHIALRYLPETLPIRTAQQLIEPTPPCIEEFTFFRLLHQMNLVTSVLRISLQLTPERSFPHQTILQGLLLLGQ